MADGPRPARGRPERKPDSRPWLVRAIVVVAVLVLVGGVVWASLLGHLVTPIPLPSRS